MKEIPLTQGKVALVDDADYEWLMQWKWQYAKDRKRKTGYAKRTDGPRRKPIAMHRVIMQTPPGMQVDHIDRDGCNDQRYNLRNCHSSQNKRNSGLRKNNRSGYKGVSWHNQVNKWRAQITVNSRAVHLGLFNTIEEAAHAYDQAAIKYYGQFAYLNLG